MLRRSNMHSQNVTDRHDEVRPEAKRRRKDPPKTRSTRCTPGAKRVRIPDGWWSEKIEDPKTKRASVALSFRTVSGDIVLVA